MAPRISQRFFFSVFQIELFLVCHAIFITRYEDLNIIIILNQTTTSTLCLFPLYYISFYFNFINIYTMYNWILFYYLNLLRFKIIYILFPYLPKFLHH